MHDFSNGIRGCSDYMYTKSYIQKEVLGKKHCNNIH